MTHRYDDKGNLVSDAGDDVCVLDLADGDFLNVETVVVLDEHLDDAGRNLEKPDSVQDSDFGSVGGWAVSAPLSGAVVAPASVAIESNRKTIQHVEDGIVARIHVKEGQRVARGDLLIELKSIEAMVHLEPLRKQLLVARASEARLMAEQHNKTAFAFPQSVIDEHDADISRSIQAQTDLFADRRAVFVSEMRILERRLDQIDRQFERFEERIRSLELRRAFINEEIERPRKGGQLGAAAMNLLAAMEREVARLTGEIGASVSVMARIDQKRTETEIEILQVESRFRGRAVAELKEVRDEIVQIQERLSAANDVLTQTAVLSPNDGVVQNLETFAIGEIIRSGDPIMDIVPLNDDLVVNAKVRPLDIDSLTPGMAAEVRFPALPQREMPVVLGAVEFLSPDIITPDGPEGPYHLARIVVEEQGLTDAHRDRLAPGMPAEVVVPTNERTMAQCLVDLLRQAIRIGMREN